MKPSPFTSPLGVPQALSTIERSAEFTTPSRLRSPGFWHDEHWVRAVVAHIESHSMSQQKLSAAHTASQQAASLQAGPVCALQQSPAVGFPQVPAHPAHRASAVAAQVASQPDSQQNGSSMQTVPQHAASEHDGVACAVQQSPLETWPQPGPQSPQTCLAVAAQVLSHDWMQQTGSTTQSERQQRSSEHPGVACAVQQSPPAGPPHPPPQSPQRITAASAHD